MIAVKWNLISLLCVMALTASAGRWTAAGGESAGRKAAEGLAGLEVGGRAATPPEIQAAFFDRLDALDDDPSAQIDLAQHYLDLVVRPRRWQFAAASFFDVLDRLEAAAGQLDGDDRFLAEADLLSWRAEAGRWEDYRTGLAEWRDEAVRRGESWNERRFAAQRAGLERLWGQRDHRPAAMDLFFAWLEQPPAHHDERYFRKEFLRRMMHDAPGAGLSAEEVAGRLERHAALIQDAVLAPLDNDGQRAEVAGDLARAWLWAGQPEKALALADRWEPHNVGFPMVRFRAWMALGRPDDAREGVSRRFAWNLDDWNTHGWLREWADGEGRIGDPALAESLARLAWDTAVREAELDEASRLLARALARRADPESAAAALAAHAGAGGEASAPTARNLPFQRELVRQAETAYAQDAAFRDRARRYLYAGEAEKAWPLAVQNYRSLATHADGLEESARMVAACLRARAGGAAAATAFLDYLAYGPEGADGVAGNGDDLVRPELPVAETSAARLHTAHRRMATHLREEAFGDDFQAALLAYGTELSLAGDADAALGVARAAYAWARDRDQMDKAVPAVASALRLVDGHAKRAEAFLLYQSHGPEREGRPAPEGAVLPSSDPLAGVALTLPSVLQQELSRLEGEAERRGAWRVLGHARLLSGNPAGAAQAYRRSRPGMLLAEATVVEHWKDMLAVRKAADGHAFGEDRLLVWFRHGAHGPDGQPGTADDLADPMADLLGRGP